jgi:hypothetical protein
MVLDGVFWAEETDTSFSQWFVLPNQSVFHFYISHYISLLWKPCFSASTFIKLDFLFSSLFIAIFPARNCNISWQISWHFLYLYLGFRSFPTISFTVTIHSLQKYDLKLKISANSVFILESWDFRRFRIVVIFLQYFFQPLPIWVEPASDFRAISESYRAISEIDLKVQIKLRALKTLW